jgi:hypothetical protein
MCEAVRSIEMRKSEMGKGMWTKLSKGRGAVEGASGRRHLPHLLSDHAMRGGRNEYRSGQHTAGFRVFSRLSRAVEFIIDLGTLGKISVALTQSRTHAWLRLSRYSDVLFQRNGSPKREEKLVHTVRLNAIQ